VKVEKTEKGASNMINADDDQGDLGHEVSGKDIARSSSISGRPSATDLMTLVNILHLEFEGSRHREKDARSKRDAMADQVRSSMDVVDSFQAQLQYQISKGKQLAARDVKDDDELNRQNMQVECIWSMLVERKAQLEVDREALKMTKFESAKILREQGLIQIQFDAISAEQLRVKRGNSTIISSPFSIFYPDQRLPSDKETFFKISDCTLCDYGFPLFDIVIASCCHLYHPWCVAIAFQNSGRCRDPECRTLVHPDWYKSFGFGEPDLELQAKVQMLGSSDERERFLLQRTERARESNPTPGEHPRPAIDSLL
jgi:hypothetical protein